MPSYIWISDTQRRIFIFQYKYALCKYLENKLDMGFPGGSDGKKSVCNVENPGSIPGSGWSHGEWNGHHSSILAWRIPWTEEPGRLYSPWGCKESDMTEKLNFHFSLFILNKQKPKKLLFIWNSIVTYHSVFYLTICQFSIAAVNKLLQT